jgi:hypothetical protein
VLNARNLDDIDSRAGDHNIFHATTKEAVLCASRFGKSFQQGCWLVRRGGRIQLP